MLSSSRGLWSMATTEKSRPTQTSVRLMPPGARWSQLAGQGELMIRFTTTLRSSSLNGLRIDAWSSGTTSVASSNCSSTSSAAPAGPRASPCPVPVGGVASRLAEYAGSLFELRAAVEPLVSGDAPDAVVLYVPGVTHDTKASVLMEPEKAGTTWKSGPKRVQECPRQEVHARPRRRASPRGSGSPTATSRMPLRPRSPASRPSILKSIFRARDDDALSWRGS